MNRLLILTAGAMLLVSSAGCQSCNPFHRTCQPACAPAATYDGCGTVTTTPGISTVPVVPGGSITGPAITPVPGPEVYTPAR